MKRDNDTELTNRNQAIKDKSNKRPSNLACREGYSNGQILVHNIPLLTMYILGTIIILILNLFLAIIFILYLILNNYLFMVLICAYCPHYGTRSSLCGYGLLTKSLTTRKSPREFKRNIKRFIVVIFPNWFAPLITGIYLLWISFDWVVLVLYIIFIIVGFVGVPYISKSKACDTCKLRKNCPWMSLCSR